MPPPFYFASNKKARLKFAIVSGPDQMAYIVVRVWKRKKKKKKHFKGSTIKAAKSHQQDRQP